MQGTKGSLKIPTAQAMTVLLFILMFAKGCASRAAEAMPEFMRSECTMRVADCMTGT